MDPEGRGDRGSGSPEKPLKDRVSNRNTGPVTLKNHKATKPAFHVRPSSARQRNTISFKWRFAGGPSYSGIGILSSLIN